MIDLIESRIAQWRQGQDQLQARRRWLVGELREVDANMLANQGAIDGATELLEMVRAAKAPKEAQEERDADDIAMESGADAARD